MSESAARHSTGHDGRETEQFIGVTGLHQLDTRNRHVQFGITVGDKSAWDKGYGTEATR